MNWLLIIGIRPLDFYQDMDFELTSGIDLLTHDDKNNYPAEITASPGF